MIGAQNFTREQIAEIVNLYHLARTALADKPDQSRFARMHWASAAYAKEHNISTLTAYKQLSRALDNPAYQGQAI